MTKRWTVGLVIALGVCNAWAADLAPCELAKLLAQQPEMKAEISKAGAQRFQQETQLDALSKKGQDRKELIQSCYRDAYAVTTGTPLQPLVQDAYASWLLFRDQPSGQNLRDFNRANAKLQSALDAM